MLGNHLILPTMPYHKPGMLETANLIGWVHDHSRPAHLNDKLNEIGGEITCDDEKILCQLI